MICKSTKLSEQIAKFEMYENACISVTTYFSQKVDIWYGIKYENICSPAETFVNHPPSNHPTPTQPPTRIQNACIHTAGRPKYIEMLRKDNQAKVIKATMWEKYNCMA